MADAALEVITTLAVMADNGSVVEVGRRTFEPKILLRSKSLNQSTPYHGVFRNYRVYDLLD